MKNIENNIRKLIEYKTVNGKYSIKRGMRWNKVI